MDRWIMDLEAVNRTLAATVRKQEAEIKALRRAFVALVRSGYYSESCECDTCELVRATLEADYDKP